MEKDKTIYQLLLDIQEEVNVPKDQYNEFGGFKYRNAETILTAIHEGVTQFQR